MRLIPVTDLDEYLPMIGWHLESFADRSGGAHKAQWFIDSIRAQRHQCWVGMDGDDIRAVALTTVAEDDNETVTLTHCAGGGMAEWVHLVDGITGWASERGSKRFKAVTRPGWERKLAPFGFKKTHIVMEYDLGQHNQ